MTYKVIEYNRSRGCGTWDAPGLEEIPAELIDEVRNTVREVNARLGWIRYQVLSYGPYETCLTEE